MSKYQNATLLELLQILDDPVGYTNDEITEIKDEVKSRNVSKHEMERTIYLLKSPKTFRPEQAALSSVLPTEQSRIDAMVVFLVILSLQHIYYNLRYIGYTIDGFLARDWQVWLSLIISVYLPITAYTLWKKQSRGWVMAMVWAVYALGMTGLNWLYGIDSGIVYFLEYLLLSPGGWFSIIKGGCYVFMIYILLDKGMMDTFVIHEEKKNLGIIGGGIFFAYELFYALYTRFHDWF